MTKKPTYHQLAERVRQFEEETAKRGRAEEVLRESESKYKTLLENLPQRIFYKDDDSVYLSCNENYARDLGITAEEITGKTDYDFFPKDLAEKYAADDRRIMRSEKSESIEELYVKDGEEIIVQTVKTPVKNDQGKVTGVLGIFWDITARKAAGEALRQSEERFRTQYENIPVPTYTWHFQEGELVLIDCNEEARKFSKGKINKLIGQKASAIYDDAPDILADLKTCHEQKKTIRKSMHYKLRSTGDWKYLNVSFIFVPPDFVMVHTEDVTDRKMADDALRRTRDELETIVKTRTSDLLKANYQLVQEIEERKRVEAALTASEKQYRAVLEASPDPVVVYDMAGKVIYLNPAFTNVFGWTLKQLEGKRIDYIPEENRPETQKMVEGVLSGKSFSGISSQRYTKKGELVDVSISIATFVDDAGRPAGSVHILRNVTERKKLEAQLQQAQKLEAIGTLAGGIAHDFNNLLMGIQGNVSLVIMDLPPSSPWHERLRSIESQVQSGARLTSQLLGYARKGRCQVQPIDLNRLLTETSETFGRTRKNVTVRRELEHDLVVVEADRGQMEQVLLNLFVNAADAMPDGGNLILKTSIVDHRAMHGNLYTPEPGNYAMIRVTDTGMGMYKKTVERIFDPIFTTKERGRGTGLGLASAYGIIKGHGGYIDVESNRGQGSTFSIFLPISEKIIDVPAKYSPEFNKQTGTILLVDDEDIILDVGGGCSN